MKQFILTSLLLCGAWLCLQADITVDIRQQAVGGPSYNPVVSYTADIAYHGSRFSKWDRQVLTLRWAATYGPEVVQQYENLTDFAFEPLDQPANGGDGYYYQILVAPTASYAVNIGVGQTVDVLRVVLYANLACVEVELVTAPNAWVVTHSGEASVLHAVLGEEFAGFGNAVSTCAAFPVEYSYFEAWTLDDVGIRLAWETTHEENNEGFAVERRSTEEIFQQIGWVAGAGEPHAYIFDDLEVMPGIAYQYRLRQVDLDGVENWSKVVEASLVPASFAFSVSPNPSSGRIRVMMYLEKPAPVTLYCVDLQGRVVMQTTVYAKAGVQGETFDLQHLPGGLYIFRALRADEMLGEGKILFGKW